jgi:L-alanine-DL-glutamate epimerase-like enolase superfamily enzyme
VAIAHEVQARQGKHELYFSADTNEQCQTPDYIVELLTKLKEQSPRAYDELLYVEQPTERDLTAHRFDMRTVAKLKPVILDESLTGLEEFDLAMELGWSGIALKTCKCQSAMLVLVAKATHAGIPYTIQDLTNPALALIQCTGLGARLNPMKGIEANSRQFFPKSSEPEAAVHPGIFTVKDGMVSTASLKGTGLGFQMGKIRRTLA